MMTGAEQAGLLLGGLSLAGLVAAYLQSRANAAADRRIAKLIASLEVKNRATDAEFADLPEGAAHVTEVMSFTTEDLDTRRAAMEALRAALRSAESISSAAAEAVTASDLAKLAMEAQAAWMTSVVTQIGSVTRLARARARQETDPASR